MPLSDLPSLQDRPRQSCPKGISRLDAKVADQKDDKALEAAWKKAVWLRDKGICRVCGVKAKKTLELDPKRGEVHHVAGRADKAVKWDVRNGLLCCFRDHQRLTRHQLHIVQPAADLFVASNGKSYIDASKDSVRFVEAK